MIPKQAHKVDKILRYISILFVIALWFVSIIGTGCGGGSDVRANCVGPHSIFVIYPYRYAGLWFFDDASRGLVMEGFEPGISAMIDIVVEDIPDEKRVPALIFRKFFSHVIHTLLSGNVRRRVETGICVPN